MKNEAINENDVLYLDDTILKHENDTFHGEAGGGMVITTVNGIGLVTDIHIDPVAFDKSEEDFKFLGDLLKCAINDAQQKAGEALMKAAVFQASKA